MSDLNELVVALAETRNQISVLKEELEGVRATIDAEFGAALDTLMTAIGEERKNEETLLENLRRAAVVSFAETGDKHPHEAVTVKEYTVVHYDDAEAFDYCLAHLPGALTMSNSKFEKVAKVAGLDFVVLGTEARATIARDLSGYLEAE